MAPILSTSLSIPSGIHAYSTTEAIIDKSQSEIRKELQKRTSKCLVYTLAGLTTLLAVWLVFASVVLRVRDPKLELRSARVMHISYRSTSPSASFNVTMIARMSIMNPNFGGFDYGNSTVSVMYGVVSVGAWEMSGAIIEARETKEINVMVNMRLLVRSGNNVTNEIHSGILKLRSYTKLSGTVHLLKMVKKRKIVGMACSMNLNLTSHSIHRIQC